jgi:hypothetical protein
MDGIIRKTEKKTSKI